MDDAFDPGDLEEPMSGEHFGEDHARTAAESYQRYFVPAIGAPLAARLVDLAEPAPGERVLDVACGTGVVARTALERVGDVGSVVGLDVNPDMLAVARSAGPSGDAIEWHEATAESMPLADESFDVVLCQLSVQFFPDPSAALREMRRVLVDGGRLALNVPGPPGPQFVIFADALERHLGPEPAGFVRRVFSLHDVTEIQRLLTGADFADVEVRADTGTLTLPSAEDFLAQYVASTPLAPMLSAAPAGPRAAMERETLSGWREFEEDGAMAYRQRVVEARARR